MTITQLIKELSKFPPSTIVLSDDGTGWSAHGIYLDYDEEEKTIGIYAETNEEDEIK